ERRLEGILRILLMMEHPPANPQHHFPMTGDEGDKGSLVSMGGEILQELPVATLRQGVAGGQLVDVPKNKGKLGRGHGRDSPVSGSLHCSSRPAARTSPFRSVREAASRTLRVGMAQARTLIDVEASSTRRLLPPAKSPK